MLRVVYFAITSSFLKIWCSLFVTCAPVVGYTEGFRRFLKQASKMCEVVFYVIQKYICSENLFNTVCLEIKRKC